MGGINFGGEGINSLLQGEGRMGGVDEGICGRGGGGDSPLSPLQ